MGNLSVSARRQLLEQYLPTLLDSAPEWAKEQTPARNGWTISLGKTFNIGGFCVYYGFDEEAQEPVVLLQTRKEIAPDNSLLRGCVGGYVTSPEQVFEGLARETDEEVCDDKGKPILSIDANIYQLMLDGVDNTRSPNINYSAYAYQLSQDDIQKLKTHIHKLDTDKQYAKDVHKASDGEVYGLELVSFKEFAEKYTRHQFTYHRQHDCISVLTNKIQEHAKVEGKTIQDVIENETFFSRPVDNPGLYCSHLDGGPHHPNKRPKGVSPAWVSR